MQRTERAVILPGKRRWGQNKHELLNLQKGRVANLNILFGPRTYKFSHAYIWFPLAYVQACLQMGFPLSVITLINRYRAEDKV